MIIVAWNGDLGDVVTNGDVFKKVLSVFITAAILKFGQGKWEACFDTQKKKVAFNLSGTSFSIYIFLLPNSAVLDIILSWKSQRSMSLHVKLRYVLKALSAAAWVIVLPVTYAYAWESNAPGIAQTIKGWFGGNSSSSPSLYFLAVLVYLAPNMLAAVLFLFPSIRRFLERSHYKVIMLMMWWSQVCWQLCCFRYFFFIFLLMWFMMHYLF